MNSRKIILLAFIVSLATSFASPAIANADDLGQPSNVNPYFLLARALENHEEIKNFTYRVERGQAALRQSQGLYYPQLDLFGDGGWEKIEREYSLDTDEMRHNVTLRATQLITDFGRTSAIIKRSQQQLDQDQTRLDVIRLQILQQGISTYIAVVRARERLKTAIKSENRIKELTGIEELLVKKGAGLSSDVLQAKSQLAGARALRVDAQGELKTARNRFQSIFYHYPGDSEVDLFLDIPFPASALPDTLDQAIETALDHNPELGIIHQDVFLSNTEITLSQKAFFPTFNLFAYARNADDDDGTLGYRRDYAAGVEFNYNLFRGGSDQAAVKSAISGANAAKKHLAHIQQLIQEQVSNGWEQLSILQQRYELLINQTDILENFLELAKKERKMGTRSLLDVLNGEVNYIYAQGNAIAAREDIKIAAYNLLFAMGTLHLDLFSHP